MKIKVGDYVYCHSNNEYGFVEKMQDSFVPGGNQIVVVRIEHDGMIQYHYAHQLVLVNSNTSPVCESASAKTVSGEVRQTSDSGAQKGSKLTRYDMIPADALDLVAKHYGKGAEKYPPFDNNDGYGLLDNYRRGYAWSLSFAAMMRHAWAFWRGEDNDPETGSPHLAAVVWHALTMMHWSLNDELTKKYDDRPRL